jgi:uncharacterized protein
MGRASFRQAGAAWLIAAALLAGCSSGTAAPHAAGSQAAALQTTEVPSATASPVASQASAQQTAPAPNEGGITAGEPTIEPTLSPSYSDATATALPSATPGATSTATAQATATSTPIASVTVTATFSTEPYPLQIEVMRQQSYPGSEIVFEQTLQPGSNYSRYVVSYQSDGYKIYALMTIPNGAKPAAGWPAIIFNHGFIPPEQYRTTERYVAYVDYIASRGYIVFKSDYRGHGSSEGPAEGGYGTPGYTDDVLNALASVQAYKDTDPDRIGMWGHSMGGSLTLRAMVVSKDIRAGVIWGGVVAPYPDVFLRPPRTGPTGTPRPTPTALPPGRMGPYGRPWRQELTTKYGSPAQNPAFWASISPNSYLADISGPLQLDHSTTDEEVPVASSQALYAGMQAAGKTVELYTYPGDNHNISANFNLAMQRTVAFFDKYVKGAATSAVPVP